MPAPSYRWLTCDLDGRLCLWLAKPALGLLGVEGAWFAPGPCRIVSPSRLAKLRAQGVAIPAPGGITDMEGNE